jgi:hypothetical protein
VGNTGSFFPTLSPSRAWPCFIDDTDLYHIGASLKDLGKKWFAFSRMDIASVGILERISRNGRVPWRK